MVKAAEKKKRQVHQVLKYFSPKIVLFFIPAVLITLSACGGGGSSSGGGPSANFSGTYLGTQNLRLSGPRIQPVSDSAQIGLVVNAAGRVVYTDGESAWEGQVNGNSFEINADIEPAERIAGILCRGSQRFNGTITGNVINGQYEAKLSCFLNTGRNETTNLLATGNFRATKTSTQTRALTPSDIQNRG